MNAMPTPRRGGGCHTIGMKGGMPEDSPYLTVVVASRNDDHGGNLLRRMQIFVDGLFEQCRRHHLDAELILVEWNPPPDRPRLAQALRWPADPAPCTVRIIEVPPEVHARFRHSQSLPLFQMIAKNVGIRHARGRFVLSTNIDILFSDGLMARLARRDLTEDRMYRVDRYDVREDVPVERPVAQKLAYCEKNTIRINKREGTYDLITRRLDRIYTPRALVLLRALSVTLLLPVMVPHLYRLQKKHRPLRGVRSFIRLRRRRVRHRPFAVSNILPVTALWLPFLSLIRRIKRSWKRRRPFRGLRRFIGLQRRRLGGGLLATVLIALKIAGAGLKLYLRWVGASWRAAVFEFRRGRLHTNACGDFTLLAQERWFDLGGYAEFEMYSFHIDSLLCHAAACSGLREEVFKDPARIYHVEHSEGSGFTRDGQDVLWARMKSSGIPRLGDREFWDMVMVMRRGRRPGRFNDECWGLAEHDLPDTDPLADGANSLMPRPVRLG